MKTMTIAIATSVLSFQGAIAQQTETSEQETSEGIPATAHQEEALEGDLVGQLDKDGDGLVSQEEAGAEARLSENWDQYDENADGMLDSRELDRFEQDLLETEEAE